jgi:hypothetical protein
LAHVEQSLDLPSDRPHIVGQTRVRQRAVAHPMPPVEHLAGLCPQGLSNGLRLPTPLDHGLDIAQQMRPAQLPPPARIPVIGAPAIRHQIPQKRSPKSSLATFRLRDSRTTKTVTQAVTAVHSHARCCPSRHPGFALTALAGRDVRRSWTAILRDMAISWQGFLPSTTGTLTIFVPSGQQALHGRLARILLPGYRSADGLAHWDTVGLGPIHARPSVPSPDLRSATWFSV